MQPHKNGVYFDFLSEESYAFGFGFAIAEDSPDELMAQRMSRKFEEGKSFRMVVVAIEDLP